MPKENKPNKFLPIQEDPSEKKIKVDLEGQEIIRFIAKTLPHKPGVYQMESEKGEILYIGKAKNLAKSTMGKRLHDGLNYADLTQKERSNAYKLVQFVGNPLEVGRLVRSSHYVT